MVGRGVALTASRAAANRPLTRPKTPSIERAAPAKSCGTIARARAAVAVAPRIEEGSTHGARLYVFAAALTRRPLAGPGAAHAAARAGARRHRPSRLRARPAARHRVRRGDRARALDRRQRAADRATDAPLARRARRRALLSPPLRLVWAAHAVSPLHVAQRSAGDQPDLGRERRVHLRLRADRRRLRLRLQLRGAVGHGAGLRPGKGGARRPLSKDPPVGDGRGAAGRPALGARSPRAGRPRAGRGARDLVVLVSRPPCAARGAQPARSPDRPPRPACVLRALCPRRRRSGADPRARGRDDGALGDRTPRGVRRSRGKVRRALARHALGRVVAARSAGGLMARLA